MRAVTDVVLSEAGRERRRRVRRRRVLRWGLIGLFVAGAIWRPLDAFVVVFAPADVPLFTPRFVRPFAFAASALGVLLAVYGLALVLAQKKQIVLYLRHFRVQRAAHNMKSVLRTRFSSQCRVVTLDDATFRAMDVGRGYKSSRLLLVVGVVLLVGLFAGVLVFSALNFAPTMNAGQFIWLFIAMSLFLIAPLVIGGTWLFLLLLVALMIHFWRVRKRSRLSIRDGATLEQALDRIASLSSPGRKPVFVAPQATVVKVTDELWKAAVEKLASVTDAVIIDVSTITENVLWELHFLGQHCSGLPIIYIADSEAQAEPGPALPGDPDVVLYTCNRSGIRKLRTNLRNFLDNTWEQLPARQGRPSQNFRRGAATAVLYFSILSLISWSIWAGLVVLQSKIQGKRSLSIQHNSSPNRKP